MMTQQRADLVSGKDVVTGRHRAESPRTEGPAIEITALTKAYGRMVAVDHLTLTVNRGDIFGFLGPNGAGKTTTMRMLLGLIQPTSGARACWASTSPPTSRLSSGVRAP